MLRQDSLKFSATLAAAVVVLALATAGTACAGESASAAFLGKEAPAFSLPDAMGSTHSLTDLRGEKGTVIMWVSTQCPVSNAYNSRMAAVAKEYSSKGFIFVGINSNKAEASEEITSHAKQNSLDFTILKDAGNMVADKYSASVTPEVFVLDSKGIVRYHGRIDDSQKEAGVTSQDLKAALDSMLSGKEIARSESKAFGCTIKRVEKAGA